MDGLERGLIGGMMENPAKVAEVYEIVKPQHFQDKKCGIIYQTILDLIKSNDTPDLLAVSKAVAGKIDLGWLSNCHDSAVVPTRLPYVAKDIADSSTIRKIKTRAKKLSESNLSLGMLVEELFELANESISHDHKSYKMADVVKRFRKTVQENCGKDYGIHTGYEFLENKYIRYMPGHVWVIGAKTSAGKTATVVDMVCRLMEQKGRRAAIASTEMMEEQNIARMLARMTGFHSNLILSGKLQDGWPEVDKTLSWLEEKDLFLFDDLYSFQDIEMRLRQITMSGRLDVVFIDYVQNMTWAGSGSEYEKTNNIAKGLQRLAKQLKTNIVCLSQVSNSTARGDHNNLEFKGGGELAAVADLGVMLKRNPDKEDELGFIIEKNRHGQTGKQVLQFVNNYTRLKEVIDHAENK